MESSLTSQDIVDGSYKIRAESPTTIGQLKEFLETLPSYMNDVLIGGYKTKPELQFIFIRSFTVARAQENIISPNIFPVPDSGVKIDSHIHQLFLFHFEDDSKGTH